MVREKIKAIRELMDDILKKLEALEGLLNESQINTMLDFYNRLKQKLREEESNE